MGLTTVNRTALFEDLPLATFTGYQYFVINVFNKWGLLLAIA